MAHFVAEIHNIGYSMRVVAAKDIVEAKAKLSNIYNQASFNVTPFEEATLKERLHQLEEEWEYHDRGHCSCDDDDYMGRSYAEWTGYGENCGMAMLLGTCIIEDIEDAIKAVTSENSLMTEKWLSWRSVKEKQDILA